MQQKYRLSFEQHGSTEFHIKNNWSCWPKALTDKRWENELHLTNLGSETLLFQLSYQSAEHYMTIPMQCNLEFCIVKVKLTNNINTL